MVDFNINLAKSMTSTPEERMRFYNRMLIYLVVCAAMLVGVSYLASKNLAVALTARKERKQLIRNMASASEYGKAFFNDPGHAFGELESYEADLDVLRGALEQRSQFLPVLSQLFNGFPDNVILRNLVANAGDKSIEFMLEAPVIDEKGNDVLRALQEKWRSNEQLRTHANTVTQLTSEREMVGDTLMAYTKYKCVLK